MKRSELFFTAVAVPIDYLMVVAAAMVAYQLRYLPTITQIRPVSFDLALGWYVQIVVVIAAVWIVVFALAGLYQLREAGRQGGELRKIVLGVSTGVAGVVAVMFFSRYLFESRFIIIAAWALAIAFVGIGRWLLRRVQQVGFRFGVGVHRVVFIGGGSVAADLRERFRRHPGLGYRLGSQYPDFSDGVRRELEAMAQADVFDEVIQTNPELDRQQTIALVSLLDATHREFKYTADLLGLKVGRLVVRTDIGAPIVEVKKTPLDGWGRIAKRGFDLVLGTLLIALTAPLMVAAALAIKLTSRGPVLFSYRRIGERGRPFTFVKFRSMVDGAHALRFDPQFVGQQVNLRAGTPLMKFARDPRITPVGRRLRRWSIDELPQLALVLRGTMSLVGPRPHEVEEVARYDTGDRQTLAIKPGVTGLAQVSGRSDLAFRDEVWLDRYYIEHWSLWLDLRIILLTPLAIIRKRAAE